MLLAFSGAERFEDSILICYPKAPFFVVNHVSAVNTKEEQLPALLDKAETCFRSKKVPFVAFRVSPMTTPSTFAAILKETGFSMESDQSVMVYDVNSQEMAESSVQVRAAESSKDIEIVVDLMMEIFEMPPDWRPGFLEFNLESQRKNWKFYLAYIEGKPVGTCALFSSNGVGGIFNVGTLSQFRNRGIGSALTLHALKMSTLQGNVLHTLQAESGKNAEQLYLKLGFKVDHKAQFYVKNT